MNEQQIYQVGIAELRVASGSGKIVTLGLGSCVAICAFDPLLKVAGMVHVMLPFCQGRSEVNPAKFGDTAVPLLIKEMIKAGAQRGRIWLKIAGGAQMFSFNTKASTNTINIGERNVEAIETACFQMGLTIQTRLVGGNVGRSVYMDVATGDVEVKTINKGIVHL
jgi:chemotaxis protein CheD